MMTSLRSRVLAAVLLPAVLCALSHAGEDADFRKAHGYYTLQEYALAIEAFDAYLKENPKAERAEQARLLLAEGRYQLKHYKEASANYALFLKDYPLAARRPEALLRAVKVNFLLKEHEKSLAAAENFLKENRPKLGKPDAHPALPNQLADALYYAGENAYALKNPALAQAHWEELVATQPGSKLVPDASDGLGSLYFDAKEFDKALPRFQFTAKAAGHPRAPWAKLMEARTLSALKKNEEAIAALSAVPASGIKELEAELALRGIDIFLSAAKYHEALTACKNLAKDFPGAPTTSPAIAAAVFACVDAQRQAETVAFADLYLAAAPAGPERAAMQRLKARALASLTDLPEALKAAKKAADDATAITDLKRKAEEHPAALMLLAELSGAQGAEMYKQTVQLYPESRFGLAARYELARLASQAGKVDEALTEIQTLIDLLSKQTDPKLSDLKRDAFFAAGDFAFRKPDFKTCEEFLKSYRELAGAADPRADDIARKFAWSRHEQNDPAGAAKILDEALQKFTKSTYRDEMLYLRSLAATKLGGHDDALKFIDTLLTESPASTFAAEALYDASTMLYKQQKYGESIARLSTLLDTPALAASPLRSAAFQLRASARLQSGKFADAHADSAAAIKAASADGAKRLPALRLIGALALLSQKDKSTEAEAALSDLIKEGPAAAPEVKQALLRRAQLRFEAKKFAEAKADFTLAAGDLSQPLTPEALDAALRLALCHKELKESAEARTLLEKLAAQKLDGIPGFEIPFQIGNFLFEANDAPGAIASYERALKAAEILKDLPATARGAATLNLAWAYKRSGSNEKAEKAFADVVTADPEGAYAAEALYERGRSLDESGKVEESRKVWQELIDRKAGSPFTEKALLARSQSLAKSAKFADAAKGFESYVQKFPKSAALREAWLGLAESHLNAANSPGAKDAFTQVLGDKGHDADLDELSERALLGLAEIALKQGESLPAKKMALRILTERAISPWRDAAFFTAGQSSEQLAEPQKAIGYYRKLLAEHPKSTHMDAATARLKALGAPVQ